MYLYLYSVAIGYFASTRTNSCSKVLWT